MKAEELDQKFDDGEDVLEYLDFSTLRRPGLETKEVNVDFHYLDGECAYWLTILTY